MGRHPDRASNVLRWATGNTQHPDSRSASRWSFDGAASLRASRPVGVAQPPTGMSNDADSRLACRLDSGQSGHAGHSRGVIAACPHPFDAKGRPFDEQLAIRRERYPTTYDRQQRRDTAPTSQRRTTARRYGTINSDDVEIRLCQVHIGESAHRPCRWLAGPANSSCPHPRFPPQTAMLGLRRRSLSNQPILPGTMRRRGPPLRP